MRALDAIGGILLGSCPLEANGGFCIAVRSKRASTEIWRYGYIDGVIASSRWCDCHRAARSIQ